MYRKIVLTLLLLAWSSAYAADQTLLECAKIKDNTQRVNCYDKIAKKVKQTLGDEYSGTAKQRQSAKDASITNTVVNIREQDAAVPVLTIKKIFTDQNGRITYLTSDGRYFRRSASSPISFRKGDQVHIKHGMLGSTFLVSSAMTIKVTEVN